MFEHDHPTDWTPSALYDLAEWVNGLAFRDIQFTPTGKPVIKIAELKSGITAQTRFTEAKFDDSVHVSAGDMLFSWSGNPETSIDVFFWSDLDGWLNQHIFKITPKAGVERRFLFYILKFLKPSFVRIASNKQTTGLGHVTVRDLRAMTVGLPTPEEQRAIIDVLAPLDDKIELIRQMNNKMEALAQTIFKSSFNYSVDDVLPPGWRPAKISELCDINAWTLGKNDELERIEYVEISEVSRGNIACIQDYERGQEPSRARRRLRHGDTVLSTVRPERGAFFLCLNPSPNLIASTGFAVLSPTTAPWSFIHAAMTQSKVFEYLGQQADGGAYPAVRPEVIGNLEFPWPENQEIVDSFDSVCSALYERAELNRKESRTLIELRDTLIPKLLSGEVRVPFAAKQVKEATR